MADVKRAADMNEAPGNAVRAEVRALKTPTRAPTPSVRPVSGSIGPYSLLCELGSGGMGKVFLAKRWYAAGVNRIVALKVQRPEFALHPRSKEMFLEEASIAARIVHPYVCAVNDVGVVGDACYVVMDYLVGEPLSRVAERMEAHPSAKAISCTLRMIGSLCEGLHAVHEARDEEGAALNVVHRDIAPDNLFVLYDGTVRVTDFGVACTGLNRSAGKAGGIVGKCAYMAPEQMRGQQVDRRSDIWSMSVVLWEMLTGRTLFRHLPDMAVVAQVLTTTVEAPSIYNPLIPRALDDVVLRGLCHNPDARYASARELGSDLERVLDREFGRVSAEQVGSWLDGLFPGGREFRFRLVARAKELLDAQRNSLPFPSSRPLRNDDPVDRALSRLSSPSSDAEQALTFVYEPEEHALRATPARLDADAHSRSEVFVRKNPALGGAAAQAFHAPAANDLTPPVDVRTAARRTLPTRTEMVIGLASALAFFAGAVWLRAPFRERSGDPVLATRSPAPVTVPVADEPVEVAPVAHAQDVIAPAAEAPIVPPTAAPATPIHAGDSNHASPASARTGSPRTTRITNEPRGNVYVTAASGREAFVEHEGRTYKLPHTIALPAGENTVRVRFEPHGPPSALRVQVMPGYTSMLVATEPPQPRLQQ